MLEFNLDPSLEKNNEVFPNVQHKYPETILIQTTNKCFQPYCEWCFRKREWRKKNWIIDYDKVFNYIREHSEITDVLLSGGDPLTLSNKELESIIMKVPFDKKIRIGTRAIVNCPARIISDKFLLSLLCHYNVEIITHINTAEEIQNSFSLEAIRQLRENGITIRSQTVLLKGINDDARTLIELFTYLVKKGIVPYYLFQCRPTLKNESFIVPLIEGVKIVNEARKHLSGLAKSFRFILSNKLGKVELLGFLKGELLVYRYHQCKKRKLINKIFIKQIHKDTRWIDE